MKALVTGGAGFIGSQIADALVARGDEVLVLDDLSSGRLANLSFAIEGGARVVEGSVTDPATVDAAFKSIEPDAVFHLAGQVDVRCSVLDPRLDGDINIGGTISVLESARAHGNPHIVLSSTGGAIYGEVDERLLPVGETTTPRPLSTYGQSKLSAEGYVLLARRLHGQQSTVLRYANVYGPRQDPHGEGGVVAIFCNNLLSGASPTIFGDGSQTRDFVYVGDVVRANLAAVEAAVSGPVNIGTGSELSVLELVATLQARTEERFDPVFEAARTGELERSSLDISLARKQLGWEPTTPITDGLDRVLHAAGL